jgi:histidinol-phosphate phosphatase family protein
VLSQAVILVGGLGTRLGELTARTPKPLLPVAGRPFVEHLLQEVSRYGFRKATLLAGRFGDQVRATYDGQVIFDLAVDVVVEPSPMGTGGALAFAAAEARLDPEFLLMNGDSWIDMDLVRLVRNWEAARTERPGTRAQLLLQTVPDAARYGTVSAKDGLVTVFQEKSPESANRPGQINAGVYVLDRTILKDVPSDRVTSLETDILPKLVADGRVVSILAPEGSYFIDIGLPDTYLRADEELMRHRRRPAIFLDRDGTLNVDRGYTHKITDLSWQPDARQAVKYANDAGYYVFVVTNQAGVARGLYQESDVIAFHAEMQSQLYEIGAHVDAFEWCPFHVDGTVAAYRQDSRRRKPSPGMIEDLVDVWPVDMSRSLLIGDSPDDMKAAEAAGLVGIRYTGGSLLDLVQAQIS